MFFRRRMESGSILSGEVCTGSLTADLNPDAEEEIWHRLGRDSRLESELH